MSNPNIKPCPFCGSSNVFAYADVKTEWRAGQFRPHHAEGWVVCDDCRKLGFLVTVNGGRALRLDKKEPWKRTEERAINFAIIAWNRRDAKERHGYGTPDMAGMGVVQGG